jgi:hypothetical protein
LTAYQLSARRIRTALHLGSEAPRKEGEDGMTVVMPTLQSIFTLLIALFLLRTLEVVLLQNNPSSPIGQGLAYIIG